MEFEVVDRRKEKQAAEAAGPAVLEVIEAAVGKVVEFGKPEVLQGGKWKSIGYTLVYLGINNQQMLAGRAVGLRSDEKSFYGRLVTASDLGPGDELAGRGIAEVGHIQKVRVRKWAGSLC